MYILLWLLMDYVLYIRYVKSNRHTLCHVASNESELSHVVLYISTFISVLSISLLLLRRLLLLLVVLLLLQLLFLVRRRRRRLLLLLLLLLLYANCRSSYHSNDPECSGLPWTLQRIYEQLVTQNSHHCPQTLNSSCPGSWGPHNRPSYHQP